MSKNLVDNESYAFSPGASQEDIQEMEAKVDSLWEENFPQQIQSLRTSIGGIYVTLNQTSQNIVALNNEIVQNREAIATVEGKISEIESNISDIQGSVDEIDQAVDSLESGLTTLANYQNSSTLLFDDEAGVGQYLNLSEDFRHFKYLMFVDSNYGSDTVIVGEEAKNHTAGQTSRSVFINGIVGLCITCVDQFSGSTDLFVDFNRLIVQANSGTQLFVQKGGRVTVGGQAGLNETNAKPIWKVYGVQRIVANDQS